MNSKRRERLRSIRRQKNAYETIAVFVFIMAIALACAESSDITMVCKTIGASLLLLVISVFCFARASQLKDDELFVMGRRNRALKDGTFMHTR